MLERERTDNRCSLFAGRCSTLFLVLCFLLLLDITSAQFANTYGWGGAGNGKRSFNKVANTDSMVQNKCLPNKRIRSYIIELIQGELSRIRSCKEAARLTEDSNDYSDILRGF